MIENVVISQKAILAQENWAIEMQRHSLGGAYIPSVEVIVADDDLTDECATAARSFNVSQIGASLFLVQK